MMHFLYLYKQAANDELRYSIRSIDRHFKVDSLTVVGDRPGWLVDVNHLRPSGGRSWSRYGQVRRNLLSVLDDCPARFVLMNDDFFATRATKVPVWHRGLFRTFRRPDRDDRGGWHFAAAHTAWVLREWGYERPLNYEVHAPMKIVRDDLAPILETMDGTGWETVMFRSLYGNVAGVGGTEQDDVTYSRDRAYRPDDPGWASTTDKWWADGRIGEQVRGMYPDPSPFEKHDRKGR